MKQNTSIKLKAAFLLAVFALNTVLGFACSMGLKMGYNNHHHEAALVSTETKHPNHNSKEHQHSHQSSGSKDDCCSHGVTSFNLLEKTPAHAISLVHPVFATAFLVSYYTPWILPKLFIPKSIRAFAQDYHPPIPDIRIAIQSFQI